MDRIGLDEYFLRMATLASLRSTCARRHTGCVLVDREKHVAATGYNGVPVGFPHCRGGERCSGAVAVPGESLDACLAVHAEANALLQCRDPYSLATAYCTDSPCMHCVKLLLNTSVQRVVFTRGYPHRDAPGLWTRQPGRTWEHVMLRWPMTLEQSYCRSC